MRPNVNANAKRKRTKRRLSVRNVQNVNVKPVKSASVNYARNAKPRLLLKRRSGSDG